MIRAATAQDGDFILQKARAVAGLGPRLEVDWRLLAINPSLPYKFYRVGEHAVFEDTGPGSCLLGPPEDPDEFAAFLTLLGVRRLTTDGHLPAGWAPAPLLVMVNDGQLPAAPPSPLPFLDENPAPTKVMAVLDSTEPISPPALREGFYANLCTRLNHGAAMVLGVREAPGAPLASCAGILCLTETEGYLSAVETRPEHRGKGYAAALVQLLCARCAPRAVSLLCLPELAAYYHRLGFAERPACALVVTAPENDDRSNA